MNTAKEALVSAFNKITNTVAYNPKWASGRGYLDGAIRDTTIAFDDKGYAKTTSLRDRKIVIVKSSVGNVILVERITAPSCSMVLGSVPVPIKKLFQLKDPSLNPGQVNLILADPRYRNIFMDNGVREYLDLYTHVEG